MATAVQDKYYLRNVHQEIDLLDRKLAHLQNFESFATEQDRTQAADKMRAKRDLLVTTARRLAAEGVEFRASDVPRSIEIEGGLPAREVAPAELKAEVVVSEAMKTKGRKLPSPYAGTSLDCGPEVLSYKRSKAKA